MNCEVSRGYPFYPLDQTQKVLLRVLGGSSKQICSWRTQLRWFGPVADLGTTASLFNASPWRADSIDPTSIRSNSISNPSTSAAVWIPPVPCNDGTAGS